jgi:predicted RNA-binding Zn ribbon-like protein
MYTPVIARVSPFFPRARGIFFFAATRARLLDAHCTARYACCPSTPTMLTLTPPDSAPLSVPFAAPARPVTERSPFVFVGERLWLDFVNCEHGLRRFDALRDFENLVRWLESAVVLDAERGNGIRRRAQQQPAGAAAALVDARRVRSALRSLAERGPSSERVREDALAEINRVLGRSAGTRRVELRGDGTFMRSFVPVGDAFAGLVIPVVESAADALILGELNRVRRCADPRCQRVFFDNTKNGRRRWCDMATCGNRAKAARHREKLKSH